MKNISRNKVIIIIILIAIIGGLGFFVVQKQNAQKTLSDTSEHNKYFKDREVQMLSYIASSDDVEMEFKEVLSGSDRMYLKVVYKFHVPINKNKDFNVELEDATISNKNITLDSSETENGGFSLSPVETYQEKDKINVTYLLTGLDENDKAFKQILQTNDEITFSPGLLSLTNDEDDPADQPVLDVSNPFSFKLDRRLNSLDVSQYQSSDPSIKSVTADNILMKIKYVVKYKDLKSLNDEEEFSYRLTNEKKDSFDNITNQGTEIDGGLMVEYEMEFLIPPKFKTDKFVYQYESKDLGTHTYDLVLK